MNRFPGLLLIRADASSTIGAGHLMRCLALAQAWQDAGGNAAFACAEIPHSLESRLMDERCALYRLAVDRGSRRDGQATSALAKSLHANWVVLDGYSFGADFQGGVRNSDRRVLVIDDDGRHETYDADMILNQNGGVDAALYERRPRDACLLLGCEYALLRREFQRIPRGSGAIHGRVRRLLVTLGGADPNNRTERVLRACLKGGCADCEIDVVIGPANRHAGALHEAAQTATRRVVLHASPRNLPELMARCDVAISAAGSSVYELAYFGVPMLLLVTAPNQRTSARYLDRLGAAVLVVEPAFDSQGDLAAAIGAFIENAAIRAQCAATARGLVDGRGAARVVAAMRKLNNR